MPVAFRPVMVTSFTRLEPRVEIESGEATFRIVLLASITSSSEPSVLSHPPGCRLIPLSIFVRLEVRDRKSTRLNSSHGSISYAVFCLKKKNTNQRCQGPLQ